MPNKIHSALHPHIYPVNIFYSLINQYWLTESVSKQGVCEKQEMNDEESGVWFNSYVS